MPHYQAGKQIGQGGFASIYLATADDGSKVAVKAIAKSKNQQHNIVREVEAGQRLEHKNIAAFVEHFEDKQNDYLVYEFIQGLDLFTFFEQRKFQPFTELEAKKIFSQLVRAIAYCHSKNVVHFDIKLDNIMINPKTLDLKIIDFGLCDFVTPQNGGLFSKRVGSEEYCAPEIYDTLNTPFDGTKVDAWCLGVVLYALLCASFPFDVIKRKKMMREEGVHPQVKVSQSISGAARDLICKLLETNPDKRISLEEVLKHEWVL